MCANYIFWIRPFASRKSLSTAIRPVRCLPSRNDRDQRYWSCPLSTVKPCMSDHCKNDFTRPQSSIVHAGRHFELLERRIYLASATFGILQNYSYVVGFCRYLNIAWPDFRCSLPRALLQGSNHNTNHHGWQNDPPQAGGARRRRCWQDSVDDPSSSSAQTYVQK